MPGIHALPSLVIALNISTHRLNIEELLPFNGYTAWQTYCTLFNSVRAGNSSITA
jgi:hypothetical protein